MDVDGGRLNENALKLALEIMYLLTGEVYVIIKKLGDGATSGSNTPVSEGWNLTQNTLRLPHPGRRENGNEKKILELAKVIIALLTREVPLRSQDVTVHFSMEEWEYIEGHKDLYEDVIMESPLPLTARDGCSRSSTELCSRVPHYPESRKETPNGSQDQQVVLLDGSVKRIKVEVEDPHQLSNPPLCKEEEDPTTAQPEPSSIRNTLEGCPVNPYLVCKTEADTGFIQKSPHILQHPPRPESIYRDLIMYKEKCRMNERIMELTMEIIYLLSKGDYVILKSSGEHVIPSSSIHGSVGLSRTQSALMLTTPKSLTHELHNEQKILEVSNRMIELLTGEVPLRCQDVTVYFSVEEWEYFEQHKDLYMKRLTSPGYRTSQGLIKRDAAPSIPPAQNTPYGQQNTFQGDTDFSDSEETVSDSEDYEDDESQSETETEDEIPLSKINDPDLQILLNRLRKMVRESEDYNPQCFQNDPEWGPGF